MPNLQPPSIAPSLEDAIAGLEKRAAALLSDDDSDERKALKAELAELQDWTCRVLVPPQVLVLGHFSFECDRAFPA